MAREDSTSTEPRVVEAIRPIGNVSSDEPPRLRDFLIPIAATIALIASAVGFLKIPEVLAAKKERTQIEILDERLERSRLLLDQQIFREKGYTLIDKNRQQILWLLRYGDLPEEERIALQEALKDLDRTESILSGASAQTVDTK